jgi:hypothetical protein
MALIAAHAKSAIFRSRDVLRKALRAVRSTLAPDAKPYRPELHYMRGPGPRSREAGALRDVECEGARPRAWNRVPTLSFCARAETQGFPP